MKRTLFILIAEGKSCVRLTKNYAYFNEYMYGM